MISKGTGIDRYVIEDELGRGGFGSVFLAKDTLSGALVAIKLLHPDVIQNNDAHNALLDEMINQARLSGNPNIVRILRSVRFVDRQGEHLGMVMEFVDGESLDRTIRKCGLLPDYFAVPIVLQALNGLDFAHRSGLLHRDIKPGNIIIDQDGLVKIMDFGLSKLMDEKRSASESARAASLNYIAPERLGREPIDVRTDIYSLGATFYEALTGQPPYEIEYGDWKTAELKHKKGGFPSVRSFYPEHHPALDAIISKMLDPLPAKRYQGCSEIIRDLIPIYKKTVPPQRVEASIFRLWQRTGSIFKTADPMPVMAVDNIREAGGHDSGSEIAQYRHTSTSRQAYRNSNLPDKSLPSPYQKTRNNDSAFEFIRSIERVFVVRVMMIIVVIGAATYLLWNEFGPNSEERRAWDRAILANDLDTYENYLAHFPSGEHSSSAVRLANWLRSTDPSEEHEDLEGALATLSVRRAEAGPSVQPMNHFETRFVYSPSGRRDPFKNLLAGRDLRENKGIDDNQMLIDELVLYGVVKNPNNGIFTAMIGTPEGFPMFAKVGDKFADGFLLSINETQIVLRKTHERGVPLMRPRDKILEVSKN
jgi:serine/threonine protein kinase